MLFIDTFPKNHNNWGLPSLGEVANFLVAVCATTTPVQKRPDGIEFLPNDETPSYWQMAVDKLSHAWDGVPADKVSSLEVDAVTGATYSSEGIISNVRAGIACYLESKGKE